MFNYIKIKKIYLTIVMVKKMHNVRTIYVKPKINNRNKRIIYVHVRPKPDFTYIPIKKLDEKPYNLNLIVKIYNTLSKFFIR
jgi:hypothetical protein